MPGSHSKYSASNYEADSLCPGRRVFTGRGDATVEEIRKASGLTIPPDNGSFYADEGTAAHQVLEWCLQGLVKEGSYDAQAFVGSTIEVEADDGSIREITVDEEMADAVHVTIQNILEVSGEDYQLWPEMRVNYSQYLKVYEDHGWGTSDCCVLLANGEEVHVHDLKYGKGKIVDPAHNSQGMLYALGVLNMLEVLGEEPETARIFIHQPRISEAPKEWDITTKHLKHWATNQANNQVIEQGDAEISFVKHVDNRATFSSWAHSYLRPGEEQCRFCRAKAVCPEYAKAVATDVTSYAPPAVADEFENLTAAVERVTEEHTCEDEGQELDAAVLSAALDAVDLIENWCKAVRTEADRRLLAGLPVPGYKVVKGKKGNRQWEDANNAEEMLKRFRLKTEQMYDLKLISPTTAEKLAKAKAIGPRQWKEIQGLITQSEGKAHVAPLSDPRPALDIRPVVEDFEDVTEEDDDLV